MVRSTPLRFICLTFLVTVAGCAAAKPSLDECQAMCSSQGQKVAEYRVGAQVPIFKPRPTVICSCH
jgi:hypothetical protein